MGGPSYASFLPPFVRNLLGKGVASDEILWSEDESSLRFDGVRRRSRFCLVPGLMVLKDRRATGDWHGR